MQLTVKAKKLFKRKVIPSFLPDPKNIIGVVNENFTFEGEEVTTVPNPDLGKWYVDRDGHFYWGGGLKLPGSAENFIPQTSVKRDTEVAVRIDNPLLGNLKIDQIWQDGEMGDRAVVAVLDSGIAFNCPDLVNAIGLKIGDDINNSPRVRNFVNGSTSLNDDKGHGSHCAGIVASRNNDHAVGIAKRCKLYIGKISDANNSPSVANMLKGLRWAGGLDADSPQDVDIISMSAGSLLNMPDMQPTISEILNKGKIIVCSIGNRSPQSLPYGGTFPAKFKGVISVGSTDFNNDFQSFSYEFQDLTIACAGTNIASYWINGETHLETGTSQSTAACAGIIALLVSKLKKKGEQNIQSKILNLLASSNTKTTNGFNYHFLEPLVLCNSI
ncbi:S8 family serine peptidase [Panacibacter ginsenosidivorans]|uniref:S8 family serine peptidase n=1 Tax=Panacibacter ginsenosidivorans TaxID=1813871 RepID=A0A5B8VA88_9BACT|nr:S8 family serine peptidase [Panacibacter ginsenosidivorans]QEC68035.1 S8 family serine peptidase [Panacibacter ginsenosidivorans]